ncbi:hypothetical protein CATYP_01855 [Corynebacterium atypicum]|uniref:Apolipoprotein N-acyltransferase n=1 Tax=Corynebacterium atypicum TaxID=191610 RepID=A0ABN4DFD2_9CORY|nr:hypothetical protein CATYP_01855 [Corynebacterium atypicum]
MSQERKRLPWSGWISLLISALAAAFLFVFPDVFPEGLLPYFVITIPLGVVSAIFAYAAHRRWVMVLAVITGLWPLLYFFGFMALLQIVYVLTWGHYPPADFG